MIENRGGARKGAGRKPVPENERMVTMSAVVPKWVTLALPIQGQAEFVREAIIEKLKTDYPDKVLLVKTD